MNDDNVLNINLAHQRKIDQLITSLALCKMDGRQKKKIDEILDTLEGQYKMTKVQTWVRLKSKLMDLKKEK